MSPLWALAPHPGAVEVHAPLYPLVSSATIPSEGAAKTLALAAGRVVDRAANVAATCGPSSLFTAPAPLRRASEVPTP